MILQKEKRGRKSHDSAPLGHFSWLHWSREDCGQFGAPPEYFGILKKTKTKEEEEEEESVSHCSQHSASRWRWRHVDSAGGSVQGRKGKRPQIVLKKNTQKKTPKEDECVPPLQEGSSSSSSSSSSRRRRRRRRRRDRGRGRVTLWIHSEL